MLTHCFTAFRWLALFALVLPWAGGCDRSGEAQKSKTSSDAMAEPLAASFEVEVTVDYRNSQPALEGKVKLLAGATAFSALEAFGNESGIAVQSTGEGETKFVVAIGDVVNLGAKGDNWTYRVNGQLGDRSAGIYQLKTGDKVSWIFGKYP